MISARQLFRAEMAHAEIVRQIPYRKRHYTRINSGWNCPGLSAVCRKHWMRLFAMNETTAGPEIANPFLTEVQYRISDETLGLSADKCAHFRAWAKVRIEEYGSDIVAAPYCPTVTVYNNDIGNYVETDYDENLIVMPSIDEQQRRLQIATLDWLDTLPGLYRREQL